MIILFLLFLPVIALLYAEYLIIRAFITLVVLVYRLIF